MWNDVTLARGGFCAAMIFAAAAVGACASDFADNPARARPARAVRAEPEAGDALAETMRDPAAGVQGVNVVTVDFPGDKTAPQVHTIADALNIKPPTPTGAIATTIPVIPTVIENATTAAATEAIGGGPMRIVAQQRPADNFAMTGDREGNVLLRVTSATGIGTVTLERTGDLWPGVIHVTLVYPDHDFTTLEGFKASEILADDRRVELKTVKGAGGNADVMIPGFTRSQRIIIEWVDAYR